MNRDSLSPLPPLPWSWVLKFIAGMWILVPLGLLNWLVIPTCVYLCFTTYRKRSSRPLLSVLLSPIVVLFAGGITDWFSERPCIHINGLLHTEAFNLNPATRCYMSTSGCTVDGGEWLREEPHNLALGMMCDAFGWPPKTYHNTYPTKQEMLKLMDSAIPIAKAEFIKASFKADDQILSLGSQQAWRMLSESGTYPWDKETASPLTIGVKMIDQNCAAIRLTNKNVSDPCDLIYLIDRRVQWPFARYLIDGQKLTPPYFASGKREL